MSDDPVQDRLDALGVTDAQQDSELDPVQARIDQLTKQGHLDEPTKEDKGKFSPVQAGLHMASGAVASIGAGYRGLWNLATGKGADAAADAVRDTQDRFTTDTNQTTAEALASDKNPLTWIPKGAKWAGDKTLDLTGSPALATGVETGANAVGMLAGNEAVSAAGTIAKTGIRTGVDAVKAARLGDVPANAQAAADAAASSGNAGAAGTAVDVSKLSPGVQETLASMKAAGQTPNSAALVRIAKGEALRVPVKYTAGQALQDEALKSAEFNAKLEHPEIGQHFDQQDEALQESLVGAHAEAAPTAVGNTEIQNGKEMMDSLKRYDAPIKSAITNAYTDAEQANQAAGKGVLKLDAKPAVEHAANALEDREELLPAEGRSVLDKIKAAATNDTGIPLKQAETWKTIVSRASRKYDQAGDTNAVYALSDLRDSLEQMAPNSDAAAGVKAKFDYARGLAKKRFGEQDADPAYKAAVNDETPIGELSPDADKFTNKYVINGAQANLQRLRGKLDQDGKEAMTSSAYNTLKEAAGVGKGKFQQDTYNNALRKVIAPRGKELLGSNDALEEATQIGDVGRDVQQFKRGSAPNTSHTSHASRIASSPVGQFLQESAKPIPGVNFLAAKAAGKLDEGARQAMLKRVLGPGAGL